MALSCYYPVVNGCLLCCIDCSKVLLRHELGQGQAGQNPENDPWAPCWPGAPCYVGFRVYTELVHKHGSGLKEGRTKSVSMSTPIRLVQAEEDQLPSSSNKSVKEKFAGSGLKY